MIAPSWEIAISGFLIGICAVYLLKMKLAGDVTKKTISPEMTIKKKAHMGDPDAQYYVAYLYENGISFEINIGKSFYWYCRSAIHHHPGAIRKIAQFYIEGKSIKESLEDGMWWMSPGNEADKAERAKIICQDIENKYGKKPYKFMSDDDFNERA